MKMKIERVDDIPLLISELEKSKLSELLNNFFPTHGNWQGLDGGKITVVFLTYILSCSNHRLSHVEPWALERLETLRYCTGNSELTSKDFTDDKLGVLLDKYNDDEAWNKFENAHNQELINVYNLDLASEPIRLDAMITQSHRASSGDFQYGHSKQHRADLPQLKTMVAALDPLAMPLVSYTVSGNTADDVLYLPVIQKCEALELKNQLFVGDSKMSSQAIRYYLQSKGHYYLTPLSKKQCSNETIIDYLSKQPTELTELYKIVKEGDTKVKQLRAKAFEVTQTIEFLTEEGLTLNWNERRIIVYSSSYGKSQKVAFENRILKAQADLAVLLNFKQGRKKLTTYVEVKTAVDKILQKHKVKPFVEVLIKEKIQTKTIRKYKDRPKRIVDLSTFTLEVKINETKQQQHIERLGWRVYACNAPVDKLTTEQAVICYRNEYRIEHKFDELLNRITALLPVFLKKEHRIKSLIRLLLVALKFVSTIQHQVRTELNAKQQNVKELYAGNPTRATDKPTTNLILRAFRNIHLNIVSISGKIYVSVSDLTPTQLQIINLLNFSPEIYLGMNQLSFSDFNFSET